MTYSWIVKLMENISDKKASSSFRTKIETWLAPAFLLALVIGFLLLPFPFMDKLQGVCFGI